MPSAAAAATTKAKAVRKAPAHPTFLAMVQEAVLAHPEDSRVGVSRPTIKKFLATKYKLDLSSGANINNLSNAIKRGAETGALVLPKGISGRVKLPPKKSAAGKENVAPKKAAPKKKEPAAKKPAAAKPAAAKKDTAKKAAPKKAAAAAAPKKTASGPAKKAAAKTAATKATKKAAAAPKKKTAAAKK